MPHPTDMYYRNSFFYILTQIIGVSVLLGWLAYSVQYSSLDMALTARFFDAASHAFPLREQWLAQALATAATWFVMPALIVVTGVMALRSGRGQAAQSTRAVLWTLFAVFCLTPLLVWALKHGTALPRPFFLAVFGGTGQLPNTFWAFGGVPAGGALPSSHAAVGYSLFGLYFAGWALNRPRLRWLGLVLAIVAGVALSVLRISQGAHFLSETIWSAAVAWLLCSLLFYPLVVTRHRKAATDTTDYTLDEIWRHLSIVQVQRRNTLTAYGVLFVCLLPFLSSAWPHDSWVHLTVQWVGLALILVAMLGRCWCMLYLGGRKGAELIHQGPYSISRNPLYWFSMTAVVGIGAQSGSILLGPILALFVYAVFNNVIDEEERLLRKVFGPKFGEYCAKVPRFGPKLSNWQSKDEVTVSVSGLWNTIRDALPYFLALPLFALIGWAQASGWLPVLIRLP
ncbi:phosphatase PAP2 family protein [Paralcaligenes sp. KSB-10]|uniref:phosphatase PAP2 family protein n=1 Tax=Paralcaligenes sp. KSB-10 TaxID=2901142 RepID=UPI001E5611DF|nr:phosphatase PAP2 family protein [Paralcaligenes sp. KSB-10]UHL64139.1 phosphatase PAP2 family protein [Paralcaligenes sp. KSB-10]